MFNRIDRYIIRQITGPLIVTLSIAALLLILEKMLKLFDFVVNEGGPVSVVFNMLANLTPHYMGLALPIGMLLGTLIAFRKISMSSEYDAMTNAGISLFRLARPAFMLALFLLVVNTILVGWVQPYSRYAYEGLVFDLRSGALGASIRVGEFVEFGDKMVLRIEESNDQGAELKGIFMERRDSRGSIAITAESGGFFATNDEQTILLRLYNGTLIDLNESQNKPRVLTFSQQDITIPLPDSAPFRGRGGEELEMTLPELWAEKDNPLLEEGLRNSIRGNYHWRIMHSLSFLVLPFLAIPMGLTNKRTGRSTGIIVSIALLIVYNEVMEGMETAVSNGISPYLTIWSLFGLFTIISVSLFRISAYKVGGDPLAWVDKIWDIISAPLKRMTRWVMKAEA
ncbi:LPS export ABC transporter permease LptF [Kordiimonas sp. SCSIO 12610]|uniref:LPS export ABC transporter permease LptF n=1 Tax=Kordiimonas sp. SCSIO 12610 TaxID=2829597 RepID=UPI00210CA49C|nr:LPS export ABC transporter permease LptF [Kordiimonas sp. SCSIO 12610]UTW56613.1 LPS export ABC transporter permease LptF [Kordiimonas sp. SCSIO 12610]